MINPTTSTQYIARAQSLIKWASKELSGNVLKCDEHPCLVSWVASNQGEFQSWLRSKMSTWSPATRRQYKAALTHFLGESFASSLKLNALFYADVSKKKVQQTLGKRTSARKAKQMSAAQWEVVENALIESKSSVAGLIQQLLLASRSFGLRPIEWGYAQMIGREGLVYLIVRNAKHTQGRSFGEQRTLVLDMNEYQSLSLDFNRSFSAAYQLISYFEQIRSSIDTEIEYRTHVEQTLKKCRYYLAAVNRKLEIQGLTDSNKRITLYSGRHQFAADAKKADLSPIEIAALMGHGALDTQTKHYGRKVHGQGGFHIQASSSDIQAILNRNANKPSLSM